MPSSQSETVSFDRNYIIPQGETEQLTPWLRRITAPNPSAYTFHGTGTYIIGQGNVVVIDPGPAIDSHISALLTALGDEQITHVLVTHAHLDHSPACELLRQRVPAPVYAFDRSGQNDAGRTADAGFDEQFVADRFLANGDELHTPVGKIECIHTPGHTSDHLCFALAEHDALFCGDHVMGWSTSIVSPPDGHMGDYVRSLEVLLTRSEATYWPTHGAAIRKPKPFVRGLIAHRFAREAEILACIGSGYNSVESMVPVIYADTPSQLYPAAQRSVLASIIHLQEKGRLQVSGELDGNDTYRLS